MPNNYVSNASLGLQPDPNFAGVVMLLHMDEPAGSLIPVDVKGNTILRRGNPVINAAVALAANNVLDMTAAGSYLSIACAGLAFGTADFTIEGFHRWTVASSSSLSKGILNIGPLADGFGEYRTSIAINMRPNDQKWEIYAGGGITVGTAVAQVGVKYHYALVRKSGVTTLYVNGVAAITLADTYNYTATNMVLGALYTADHVGLGYHDEVRVTKGVARYNGNFTPPDGKFPDQ